VYLVPEREGEQKIYRDRRMLSLSAEHASREKKNIGEIGYQTKKKGRKTAGMEIKYQQEKRLLNVSITTD